LHLHLPINKCIDSFVFVYDCALLFCFFLNYFYQVAGFHCKNRFPEQSLSSRFKFQFQAFSCLRLSPALRISPTSPILHFPRFIGHYTNGIQYYGMPGPLISGFLTCRYVSHAERLSVELFKRSTVRHNVAIAAAWIYLLIYFTFGTDGKLQTGKASQHTQTPPEKWRNLRNG